jgi:hypothetical protein
MAGRPGLAIEVAAADRDSVVIADQTDGTELDGRARADGLANIRIV